MMTCLVTTPLTRSVVKWDTQGHPHGTVDIFSPANNQIVRLHWTMSTVALIIGISADIAQPTTVDIVKMCS